MLAGYPLSRLRERVRVRVFNFVCVLLRKMPTLVTLIPDPSPTHGRREKNY